MTLTSEPGTVAVIFVSRLVEDPIAYGVMAVAMERLAAEQPGYRGFRSVRDAETREGISISYWADEASAVNWKANAEHQVAQLKSGSWYDMYEVEVATVIRSYRSPRERE
jgi:heme-degrading monooxygenase HmoA